LVKYRKKPIVIEAFRYGIDGGPDGFQEKVITNEIITYLGEELTRNFDTTDKLWGEIK
jgi:hypothetical protein